MACLLVCHKFWHACHTSLFGRTLSYNCCRLSRDHLFAVSFYVSAICVSEFLFFGHCHNHIQLSHNNINTCPGVRYGSASTKQNNHFISVGMVPLSHHHIPTPRNMTNCLVNDSNVMLQIVSGIRSLAAMALPRHEFTVFTVKTICMAFWSQFSFSSCFISKFSFM